MADIVRAQREQIPATMQTRYRDMGDGTHALVVAAESGAVIGPGSPTVDSFGSAVIDLAATSNNQQIVAAPGAGKQIWVYSVAFLFDTAAGTVVFHDSTPTA
ncbi:MAG: hypothetical protein BWY63_01324 [Chloroflexi bacterium ADurb.Bin360]|nr:MAG: hypothetical protein BWY63_01324 [Chloroflexi bacterium ADurb.Bin360]